MTQRKILATGLSGLVGSRLVELIKDCDFENLLLEKGFDITKKETLEEKIANSEAEYFLHLAAFTDVNAAWKEKEDREGLCFKVNVLGTKNVAEFCKKYRKLLIHFSTDFVFDGEKKGLYTEKDVPRPIEWYGQTKLLAEEEVKRSGCRYCILRIAFPFRAKFLTKADLIRKIKEGIENKALYPQFSDQIITPTFIDDIAFGVEKIIKSQTQGLFHLTGSTPLSPFTLAQKVAEHFGFDKKLVKKGNLGEFLRNNPNSRPYQKNLGLSNEKIKKELGIDIKGIDEALLEIKKQINF